MTRSLCVFVFLGVVFFATMAFAQPQVVVRAPEEVSIGQNFQFEVEVVHHGPERIDLQQLPTLSDGMSVVGRMNRPTFLNIGGRIENRLALILTIRPHASGQQSIGPATFKVGDTVLQSSIHRVNVVEAPAPSPTQPRAQPRTQPKPSARGGDIGVVRPTITPEDRLPYAGEQISLRYDLFTDSRQVGLQARHVEDPPLDAFWVEDLSERMAGQRRMVRVDGRMVEQTALRAYSIYALEPGEALIDPVTITLTSQRFFGPREDFEISSEPITIEIQPLPKNPPRGFHEGHVGNWEFLATTNRLETAVGRPITVRLIARGDGLATRVQLPRLSLPGALVSEPEIERERDTSGQRVRATVTARYVVTPQEEGPLTIPSIPFVFFDPQQGEYRESRSQSMTIAVGPGELPTTPQTEDVSVDETPTTPLDTMYATMLAELRPFDLADRPRVARDRSGHRALQGAGLVGIILFLLALCQPLARKVALRGKPARERKQRVAALRKTMTNLDGHDVREDMATIATALREYLVDYHNVAAGIVGDARLRTVFSERGYEEGLIEDVMNFYKLADRVRFGAESISGAEVRSWGAKIADLMEALEKSGATPSRMWVVSLLPLLFLLVSVPGLALDMSDVETAVHESNWEKARELVGEALLENPEDIRLIYNKGLTCIRLQDYGCARLYFERAEYLGHPDARHNRKIVSRLIRLRMLERQDSAVTWEGEDGIFWWRLYSHFSPHHFLWFGLLLIWLAFGILLGNRLKVRKPHLTATSVILFSIGLAICFQTVVQQRTLSAVVPVILLDDSTTLHEGPSEVSDTVVTRIQITPGLLAREIERRPGWVRIELSGGLGGWVLEDKVALVVE